jgi:hypothetical protein
LSALSAAISSLTCSGLGELLGLLVDAGHDYRDVHRHVVMFGEACKTVLLGNSLGLRHYLRSRVVHIRPIDLCHLLVGGDESLNLLLSELDLLHVLRSDRAGITQSKTEKRQEQCNQKAPTNRRCVSVSNERHGMTLHLELIACTPQFGPRHDG